MKQFSDEKTINMANLFQMPKIRMECVDQERNHYKYYEIETKPALFFPKITKCWGRIGSKQRCIIRELQNFPELKKEFGQTIRLRFNHGYKLVYL